MMRASTKEIPNREFILLHPLSTLDTLSPIQNNCYEPGLANDAQKVNMSGGYVSSGRMHDCKWIDIMSTGSQEGLPPV